MLPGHLIEGFWAEVGRLLQQDFGLSPTEAQEGIATWDEVLGPRVGEMVYHQAPAEVARTIAGLCRQGWQGLADLRPPGHRAVGS